MSGGAPPSNGNDDAAYAVTMALVGAFAWAAYGRSTPERSGRRLGWADNDVKATIDDDDLIGLNVYDQRSSYARTTKMMEVMVVMVMMTG